MIYVSDIIERIESALDAESSDRYLFENDYKPAINYAQEWLVSLFNSAFSLNKLSEESLKELVKVSVFRTSDLSRVSMDEEEMNLKIWSVLSIFIDIQYRLRGNLPTQTDVSISQYIPNASYITANYQAKRTTLEKSIKNKNNPFEQGNSIVTCDDLIDYAYINFADYTGGYSPSKKILITPTSLEKDADKEFVLDDSTTELTVTSDSETYAEILDDWKVLIDGSALDVTCEIIGNDLKIVADLPSIDFEITDEENVSYYELYTGNYELEILPEVSNELIAISYLRYPNNITGSSAGVQYLQFPNSLINIIVEKALQFISYKQGDSTNLYGVTKQDIKELVTLMG